MTLARPRLFALLLSLLLALAVVLVLRAASGGQDLVFSPAAELRTYDVQHEPAAVMLAEAPPPAEMPAVTAPPNGQAQAGPIADVAPRIAYAYGFSFRLDPSRVGALQERHLALCRRLGSRCRVIAMRRGEAENGATHASLSLQVAAPFAEPFGRELVEASTGAGGETVDRSIEAEDLSRQLVDTEARIRTREVLIRRLTGLLETRSGNIQQAVEAERAINTAQEELDAARTWRAEMLGRVLMSKVEISYLARGATAPAEENPIASAFRQVGGLLVSSVAAMILLVGVAGPWLLIGLVAFLGQRWLRRRWLGSAPETA